MYLSSFAFLFLDAVDLTNQLAIQQIENRALAPYDKLITQAAES